MKKTLKAAIAVCVACTVFVSCKKDSKDSGLGGNFPKVVNNVITPEILKTLKDAGATVNEGLTPPTINGIFYLHPNYCLFDNSGYNFANHLFDDYLYKFSNQNSSAFTISAQYKDVGNNTDIGVDNSSTYISGASGLFTVYSQSNGTLNGVNYVNLQLVSGEITSTGIKNFQMALYLKSKDADPTNVLAPVGTTRLFKDQDGVSEIKTTFSVSPLKVESTKAANAAGALLSTAVN